MYFVDATRLYIDIKYIYGYPSNTVYSSIAENNEFYSHSLLQLFPAVYW